MPKDLFAQQSSEDPKDLFATAGIEITPKQTAANFVGAAKNIMNTSIGDFIKDPGGDVMAAADIINTGRRRFIAGLESVPNAIQDKLLGTNKTAQDNALNARLDAEFNKRHNNSVTSKVGATIAELAPSLIGGMSVNAAKAPAFIAKAVENSPRALKGLAHAGGLALKNVPLGAAMGATGYNPDESITEKATKGGIIGGIAGTAIPGSIKAAEAIYNGARQFGKLFSGASPEVIEKNVRLAEGLPMGLGDIVESPGLKRLQENVISKIPFSGVHNTQKIIADSLKQQGESLLKNLRGNYKGTDVGFDLKNALTKAAEDVHNEKRGLYKIVDEIAERSGLKVNANNYQTTAKEILEEIKQNPFNDLRKDEFTDLLKNAVKDKSGSLKYANIYRGQLGEEISQAYRNGDLRKIGVLNQLKNALDKDIGEFIGTSRNDSLKLAYKRAQDYYKNNVAPLEEKEIARFTRKEGDTDLLLSNFIKIGRNDRGNLTEKLMSRLSENNKNLPGYGYLSEALETGADGSTFINPNKLTQLYGKLGDKQKQSLFPDNAMRKQLDNYVQLVKKNGEALSRMQNPKTGQRLGELAVSGGLGGIAVESLLTGGIPLKTLGGLAGSIGTARLGNKLLTSEKMRELYLKSLIRKDQKLPEIIKNSLTVSPNLQ